MDKPFIKLFHTPNSYYFLDVNKNDIIPISETSFNFLSLVLAGGAQDNDIPQELIELRNQGYLSTKSVVDKIRHPYTEYLDLFLGRKIQKITLQLTQNCNFRCKYCPYTEKPNSRQRTHSAKKMSWETAKTAVDFLWEHSIDSQEVNIGFYGGEPLLEFPMIRRIIHHSEKRFFGKELSFSLTTNGTLLTTKVIHFFQKHNVSLMVSLDGPQEINDRNRVFINGRGTFQSVMKQISLAKKLEPKYAKNIMISMVLDPQNDFDCINRIFLDETDIDALSIQPSLVEHEYDDQETIFSEEYLWKYQYQQFLAFLACFKRFPEKEVSPISRRIISLTETELETLGRGVGLKPVDVPSGPCIPGQMRLFVDISGKLFPCERVSETSSAMCIGNLQSGIDLAKANQILNVSQNTETECRHCWCFRYCTQCAKQADDGTVLLSTKSRLSHCDETRLLVELRIQQFLLLKEVPSYYAEQVRVKK